MRLAQARRLAVIAALTLSSSLADAQAPSPPPREVVVQAKLSDGLGNPLSGPVSVGVLIYGSAAGGVPLWSETHAATALSGVVNLRLGTLTPFPETLFHTGMLYTTFRVASDPEMAPRQQLASSPFAIRAERVAKLDASTAITPGLIRSEELQDAGVKRVDMAANAVDSTVIIDASVALDDLSADSVDSAKICNGSVGLNDLGADSVDTVKICDGSVGLGDLGTDSVNSAKICNGSVGLGDLGADSVDTVKICDGSVALGDLGADSVNTAKICDGSVGLADLGTDSVDSAKICNGSVGLADLGTDSVDSAKICDGSVTGSDLSSGAVTAAKLAPEAGTAIGQTLVWNGLTVTWGYAQPALGSIGSAHIADGSIAAVDLAAGSIGTTALANGAVTTAKLGAAGGAVGQVLQHSGTGAVQWANDSLSLPYAGSFGFLTPGAAALNVSGTAPSPATYFQKAVTGDLFILVSGPGAQGSLGVADATASENRHYMAGVSGLADGGPSPIADRLLLGVYGAARSSDGNDFAAGVYGEVFEGTGASSAPAYGVFGFVDTLVSDGIGVLGRSNRNGVRGEADGWTPAMPSPTTPELSGTLGHIRTTLPLNGAYGVRGIAVGLQDASFGVYGEAEQNDQNAYGVYGKATRNNTASKNTYGVYGEAIREFGGPGVPIYGVYGKTTGPAPAYAVYADGSFGGTGAKYFVQPHPSDPAKEIRYVCLEGPESGTYFRGSGKLAGGRAEIQVPESFRLVTEPEGLTVQLTAVGGPAAIWVVSQDLERIVVGSDRDVAFHYFANGVRRGYAGHEPIAENQAYVPHVRGLPYGDQYPEGQRKLLVESGILNPDYTPNEDTAARLGWTLEDPAPAAEGSK